MKYCTVNDVLQLTAVTADKMGIDEDDPYTLEDLIDKWIEYASALVDNYTDNPIREDDLINNPSDVTKTKKLVYEDVTSRIVANRIALRESFKNYAVIDKDDWTIGNVPNNVFTDNEKMDLSDYKAEEAQNKIILGFGAVTGRGVGGISYRHPKKQ